ncbi:hypothetical protein QTP70_008643 [Hemibagrus guttatus]|uniref:Alkylated DNA repair protein AlkB homologue 8 N-terminal domain-containing protein n=1 Tax=Hemibagrus guttatus TaxID=175788 RepID=A0AAE0Q9T7_9TELE|nr:hypothetical protein QTP70_008643 [Hemibagrus guttatus]
MRVSTSKSEAMVLDRKKVACTLQVGGEVLPQVEEFKYLGVLFTSEGRMDREIDRRVGAAAAVMRSMYWSVVVKKELSRKAKPSIYQSIYVPTLTYGHELWVMTKRVGCEIEEKERFWSELDEVMDSIPMGERVVIGADFNGHVGEGNRGDEDVMGKFGVKERNLEGQMVVDFAKRMDMAVVNTYFQKREEHRVTYKSGGRRTQVDYILCRRGNPKEISDCKVVVGESVARQHRMVVCRMTLMVCKKKRSKIEIEKKTKLWKMKKKECCEEFRQKLRQALGGQVVLPDDWETTAEMIRDKGRKVLGVSSGRRKEDNETWRWNEEVQDSIQRKRLAKKKWDMDRTEENRQEYKELQCRVKREVSTAGKMGKRKDLGEFDKGQTVMARPLDQSISKTAALVGCSRSAVDLLWSCHINTLVKKACQRLYHVRRLRDFKLSSQVLKTFYICTIESVLADSFNSWFGNGSMQDRVLGRVKFFPHCEQ